jgi:hypothetical protein
VTNWRGLERARENRKGPERAGAEEVKRRKEAQRAREEEEKKSGPGDRFSFFSFFHILTGGGRTQR